MPSLLIDIEARYAQFRDAMDNVGRDGAKAVGKIKASFADLQGAMDKFGEFAGLGAIASGAGILALTKDVADQADALSKLSQKTGIAVEDLSKFQYAASLNDATNEDLAQGFRTLSKNMADTAAGTGKARAGFEALGLTQDIQNGKFKDAGELFTVVAEKLSQYADGANKSAIAQKIFGDVGEKLIPTLNAGAAGLKEMGDEAERLGIVFSNETAQKAQDFNDNLTRIQTAAQGLKIEIGTGLLPIIAELTQQMTDGIRIAGGFGAALRTIGSINPFKSLGGNIDQINADLKKAEDTLARMEKKGTIFDMQNFGLEIGGATTKDETIKRIADLKKQREFLQLMQQREALDVGDVRDPRDRRVAAAVPEKKQAPALVLPSTMGALDDPRLKELERSIQGEQQLLAARNQAIQQYNTAGMLSFQQYYQARAAAQKEALDNTRKSLDEETALLNKKLSTAKGDDRIKIEERLKEISEKRRQVEQQSAQAGVTDWFEQTQAAKQYKDQLTDIEARLEEMRGNAGKASLIRFDLQMSPIRQRLEAEASPNNPDEKGRAAAQSTLEQVDALRDLTKAQAESQQLAEQASVVQQNLDTAERRISTDREAGMTTELDMMYRLGVVREQAVQQLEAIALKMKEVADASGDPRLIANAAAFKSKIDELRVSANVLGKKFEQVFTDNFANALSDAVNGTKSLKQAFKDMADSIVREINRIAAQEIARSLVGSSSGGGSGGSGWLSTAINLAMAYFGGTSTSPANISRGGSFSPSLAVGGVFNDRSELSRFASGGVFGGGGGVVMSPTLFKFASGGGFSSGLMGEAGAEAVMPLRRGRDGKLGVVAAGGAMSNVFHIMVGGAMSEDAARRTGMQIGSAAARKLSQASRRNG